MKRSAASTPTALNDERFVIASTYAATPIDQMTHARSDGEEEVAMVTAIRE